MREIVTHILEPVYDKHSKILILGTMPSPKSREFGFYYSHPQNRFWRVMGELFHEPAPENNNEKRAFLLRRQIAVWDVLQSCEIDGADDNSIRNPRQNDINLILNAADIQAIYTTGKKATGLYKKMCLPKTGRESLYLPSTSPANCGCKWEILVDAYRTILEHIDN